MVGGGALVAAAFFGYVAWWRLQSSPLYVRLVATIVAMFTASGDAASSPWSIGWYY